MSTFITRCATAGDGVRLAVKDLIDVAGLPTTGGCRALADVAGPAAADAACLAGARAAGARIVGKANLHELGLGSTGVNRWFGTPVNPLDPGLVPGGSSSGCAVAVATGEADVAFGTDSGGSVRIPATCCGVAALKTTNGRVPLAGVLALAPTFDTVGPMAADVGGLVLGMELLEPGFSVPDWRPERVGRLRLRADPAVDAAVDAALGDLSWAVEDCPSIDWDGDGWTGALQLIAEAWAHHRALVEAAPGRVGPDVKAKLYWGRDVHRRALAAARSAQERWQRELAGVFARFDLLALPTMPSRPPPLDVEPDVELAHNTMPVNCGGLPALSVPLPAPAGRLPVSLQLLAPAGGEERLLAAGREVEAALGTGPFGR